MSHPTTRHLFPSAAVLAVVLTVVFTAFLTAPGASAQTNHDVSVVNNRFVPRDITIQPGDSVTWTNSGVNHNVVADDGSFRCANGCDGMGGDGTPSSDPWVVTLTFNDPGTIPYFCEVHGFRGGIGMAGTVTVEGQTSSNPGTLSLSSPNYPVGEGAGTATVTVNRNNGSDGQVSVQYATSDGTASAPGDYQGASGTLDWGDGDASPKTFQVTLVDDDEVEGQERFNVRLSNPGGGANLGRVNATVTINDNDEEDPGPGPAPGNPGNLQFRQGLYEVNEADGTATVHVERTDGSGGMVSARVATRSNSGTATEDSDYTPVSEIVNFGNGDTAAKQVMIPILQDDEDEGAETINLRLTGATGGAELGPQTDTQVGILDDDEEDECDPNDPLALCLGPGGRFKVQVSFRNRDGGTTVTDRGDKLELVQDSGLFTFFDPNNAELLVKVLNGCPITNNWWVFFAGTTNVEFTLTVTDTEKGENFFRSNPLDNVAETVLDTEALATCP